MDLRMAGVDGIEATSALKLVHPGVAVVVLTLQDDEATRGRARRVSSASTSLRGT